MSPERKPLHHDIAVNLFELLEAAADPSFKVGMRINMIMEVLNSAPSPDVWIMDREKWRAARAANTYPKTRLFLQSKWFRLPTESAVFRKRWICTCLPVAWASGSFTRSNAAGRAEATYRIQDGAIPLPSPLPECSIAVADIFRLD